MVSQPVEGETPVALRAPSVSPSTGHHSEWVDLTGGGQNRPSKWAKLGCHNQGGRNGVHANESLLEGTYSSGSRYPADREFCRF